MGHPKGKKNRYYSKDEKLRVVKAVLSGKGSEEVGKEIGIGNRLIRKWVTLYLDQGENALENKRKSGNPLCRYMNKKDMSETEQLRYELARAELELAKLKKLTRTGGGAADQRSKTVQFFSNRPFGVANSL